VSREALEECHYKGGKDLLALHYAMHPQSRLYYGMNMVVGGSSAMEPLRNDAYTGDLSAIIIRNLPVWVEVRRTPVIETALMDDWEESGTHGARNHARGRAQHGGRALVDAGGAAADPGTHRQTQHAGGVAQFRTVHARRCELQAIRGAVPRAVPLGRK
jgi:hypothetical protein